MTDSLANAGLLGPGLLRRSADRAHWQLPQLGWRQRASLFAAVTWLPLAILTVVEGHFAGFGWVLSRDLGTYGRLLLAGPLLVAVEPWAEGKLSAAVRGWRTSALVPADQAHRLEQFLQSLASWRRSYRPEVALIVLAYLLAALGLTTKGTRHQQPWLFGGSAPGPLSWAGWWWALVSAPLFLHLCLRWLWRFALWTSALLRLATLPARLYGTHPDGMGGLLGVVRYHNLFVVVPLALSLVATGAGANAIFFGGATLASLRHAEALVVVLELLVFLAPLAVFTPSLIAARRSTIRRFGAVAANHAAYLQLQIDDALAADQRTLPRLPVDLLQGEGGLADTFGSVLEMRSVAATRRTLVMFAAACVCPLLLLELTEVPARELLLRVKELML